MDSDLALLESWRAGNKQAGENLFARHFADISLAEVVTSLATRLGRAQQIEQLRVALSELPADDQLQLELDYWHELDSAALGEVFEASAGTIRVRLLRARRALQARMNERGFPLPTGRNDDNLASALARPEDVDEV
jgi:DNA-directed RNA polymerase specialized sigma24 family protein